MRYAFCSLKRTELNTKCLHSCGIVYVHKHTFTGAYRTRMHMTITISVRRTAESPTSSVLLLFQSACCTLSSVYLSMPTPLAGGLNTATVEQRWW